MKKNSFTCTFLAGNEAGPDILTLEGDISIRNSAEVKTALMSAGITSPKVIIRLSNIESLDLASVQLLLSMEKTLNQSGKDVQIGAKLPGNLSAVIHNSGFGERILIS